MNSQSHTPTPWFATELDHGIYLKEGSAQHMVTRAWIGFEQNRNARADALFIVRACNSHDALIAALRDLLIVADAHVEIENVSRADRLAIGKARAALAAAE